MHSNRLPPRDALLALLVMVAWGTNFVVIHAGLRDIPPLLFGALRFLFVALPFAFFFKRPAVPWWNLASYALAVSVGPSGLLYLAMDGWLSPGLASLLIQSQFFFTIGFAMWRQGEKLHPAQIAALGLAVAGIGLIVAHDNPDATPLGVGMVLIAAFFWAVSNQLVREAGKVDMLAYVVWSSVIATPLMFLFAWTVEGGAAIERALTHAGWVAWASVFWQSLVNTMFGYSAFAVLLARHKAATVAPTTLLVPVFGIGSSALILGEALPGWKIMAAALVMGGILINMLWRGGSARPAGNPAPQPGSGRT